MNNYLEEKDDFTIYMQEKRKREKQEIKELDKIAKTLRSKPAKTKTLLRVASSSNTKAG